MRLLSALLITLLLSLGAVRAARAQAEPIPPVDSIAVEGNTRLSDAQVVSASGLAVRQTVNYRDLQRAVQALFRTGQFDDVLVEQRNADGRLILTLRVEERPLLAGWSVVGVERVSVGDVRERVKLTEGRPLDRAAVARSEAEIDSLYRRAGYYAAEVRSQQQPQADGRVHIVFRIQEGDRVAISQVQVEGNERYRDDVVAGQMQTRPEGFWWYQTGEYDEQKLEADTRERLPQWYADRGFIDFQVTGDTLIADPESASGKAILRLAVDEGTRYHVGSFDIQGNQRFSTDELMNFYPFGRKNAGEGQPFNRSAWDGATEAIQTLYANNGYIYARVMPQEERRTLPDGTPVLDLRWVIQEGQVATVNKINIVGNDVTHERVIREAIVMLPGQVFNRDALVRSYQNIGNLGFFQQPMPPPGVDPSANGVDVDLTFRVEERRTGNINFGASLGQGTGVGGFLGLEEPNLFGRGKRGRLQWQFGKNINDFTLTYSDPSIRESRVSGTVSLFDSRYRYTIADLGRQRRTGGTVQFGLPLLGSRYTRIFGSYGFQRIRFSEGSQDIRDRFQCESCSRSTVGVSALRDTRVGLPFAVGGSYANVSTELNGGILGGTGQYRKVDLEGRWYAPLGTLGGGGQIGAGVQFVLGFSARSGFIFGDAGPFYNELYTAGGVQFGVPVRGYDEFSITPDGFDPLAGGSNASADAFGKAFASFTVEGGARVSQSLYLSTFFDAGNVYRTARQYDPTRLFRGAGVGAALISPLGPIGVDIGYGFDRVDEAGNPAPGWQLHFKLGNFF